MIDLHLHSKYSDGEFTVLELLDKLNQLHIKYASITDHNCIDAHIEYQENAYDTFYDGKMFTGTELQTSIDGHIVEVLVYNYNVKEFKQYVDETRINFWKFHHEAYQELLKRAHNMGLKYIEPEKDIQDGYYCNMKFQEAIAACFDENKKIVAENILLDHLYFYRHEFLNPKSVFYVDSKLAFPKLDELLKAAHECGGIVSLAHLDEYQSINNKVAFLEYLVNNYNLDALECFHPVINEENRLKYMAFANNHNWLISAGSDFHGSHLPHRQGINTKARLEDVTILKKLLK